MKNRRFYSHYLIIGLQILCLMAIWLMAGLIHRYLLPFIPQGLLGMMFLFILLLSRKLSLKYIEKGSQFLIAHMLLFFVPAVVKIIEYKDLLVNYGVGIIVTTIGGTLAVMLAVGFVVDKVYAYELMKKYQKRSQT